MAGITQENRSIAISDFSLGKDTFLLTSFEGGEYISDLFEFHIEAISENLTIKPDSIVGKTGTVTIQDKQGRVFHGYVRSFSCGEVQSNNLRMYKMVMVPWLWFLSKSNNHRIFQDKSTKEIVGQLFQDLGFTDFDFRASGGKKREYCIQHNESDLNFVSRLLEEEGIAYYFKHEKNKHQLVIVDQKNAYDDVAQTDLEYSHGSSNKEQVTRWEHQHQFKKGQWSLSDYNFKEPIKKLYSNTKTISKFANNNAFEHYEYGDLYELASGDELVKLRMDAEEANIDTVIGTCDCSTFTAGGKFKLAKHENAAEKGAYILTAVYHRAVDTTYFSGQNGGTGYSNNFYCIPDRVHFRPERVHHKPTMRGPQSAIVTGPSGEEIYVDELGRVKVQFYWDREGKNDENTTCFIRVTQSWSGAQWGTSFIPRIGHEVIVDFMDGDPDRPIITGSVYNGKNKPPFDSKTKSGIRTRSTKGGSASNCNELIFDDKKDAEQIFIHAEKNMDTEVENDETLTVDHDRTKTVVNNESSSIGNNRSKSVGNNEDESIGKNKSITVGDNHTESIGKNMSLSVGKNISIDIAENHTESVGKNMTISVVKDLRETVDGQYVENVTKDYALSAKTITMKADDQITFKTGSASIVMKKNGDITISGKNINIKGSGNVVLKGSKVTNN